MCECAQLPSIHIPGPVFFGFLHPHFYISKHPNFDITTDKEDWLACISARLQAENRKTRGRVLDVSLEKRRSIYYYHEDEEEYMKLTLQFPRRRDLLPYAARGWSDHVHLHTERHRGVGLQELPCAGACEAAGAAGAASASHPGRQPVQARDLRGEAAVRPALHGGQRDRGLQLAAGGPGQVPSPLRRREGGYVDSASP